MKPILCFLLLAAAHPAFAQKWGTRTGQIDFFSKTPMEDIEARNKAVSAVVDPATGGVAVSMNIRDFKFDRALMQEHFNENYLESDKYPKAEFRGTLEDSKAIDWTKDGTYTTRVSGTMTIHGVTKNVATPMQILIKGGKAGVTGTFPIRMVDYKVDIPKLLTAKIAEQVAVTVLIGLQPL
ncbi:MAG: YceI family protein [Sphingobacteriales bacterium]|nr:MAG: YceI family protein [Sphingobacteriales bacterium]